jgi:hypothetical protein
MVGEKSRLVYQENELTMHYAERGRRARSSLLPKQEHERFSDRRYFSHAALGATV